MNEMHPNQSEFPPSHGLVRSVFWVFAAIAAFYLLTEHTAHVFGVLPWLLILACPLMHVFMHHGHGHGSHGKHDAKQPPSVPPADRSPSGGTP